MNRRYALWGNSAKLSVVILLAALIGLGSQVLHAQTNKPELPTLSLTGSGGGWNQTYYPDGRIWTSSRGANGDRELLVRSSSRTAGGRLLIMTPSRSIASNSRFSTTVQLLK